MRIALLCILILAFYCGRAQQLLQQVRGLYAKAGQAEDSANKALALVAAPANENIPVMQCYKGALTMVKAKYSFSPFKKYTAFKKGKSMVEKAFVSDSNNVEIRFVRFTLQTNLPAFLGYSDNINTDKQFIVANYPYVKDVMLKNMIVDYFRLCSYCSKTDIQKMAND